ncbi:hypothetical protein PHMEG_00023609 [Phytophthora megakarya]|uniref:Uncharacterized protein n=1 Tax=Phytophthora megakarya TaxID=4795 RepID=A0A225VGN7_9STRA|nr:hypothetical protein PHMEG_00023609 [Phytophthora megakarya]
MNNNRGLLPDAMEEKPPGMTFMAAWPTSSAANFSKLPQEPGVKMVLCSRPPIRTKWNNSVLLCRS